MSASASFVRAWRVGRYRCTLTLPATASGALAIDVQWTPTTPKKLTAAELEQYRSGRDDALRAWAASTGRPVAVVDL